MIELHGLVFHIVAGAFPEVGTHFLLRIYEIRELGVAHQFLIGAIKLDVAAGDLSFEEFIHLGGILGLKFFGQFDDLVGEDIHNLDCTGGGDVGIVNHLDDFGFAVCRDLKARQDRLRRSLWFGKFAHAVQEGAASHDVRCEDRDRNLVRFVSLTAL